MPDSVSSNPGMMAYVSADGVRWKRLREKTVINHSHYRVKYSDASPPAVFWSEAEQRYVAYLRVWLSDGAEPAAGFGGNIRWVGRTASDDFVNWTPVDFMTYGDTPVEQIYTNQTHPYFRAPHISIALAARFMALRQAVSDEEAKTLARIHGRPDMVRQCSDAVLMTTRGGTVYDRTFMEAFVRPDIGPENWTSRNNYAARGIVPTGPNEISFYVVREYGMPNAHLRRYSLPTDRFASVNAPYSGGEFVTKPLRFRGATLTLNFSTSAAGGIRVEIQDEQGNPIPGFTLNDAKEMIGNAIERPVSWKAGSDVSSLVGQVVRLRFVMKDADLYALRFR
jgi:hypothetical protein